jgi:hypothetical protein
VSDGSNHHPLFKQPIIIAIGVAIGVGLAIAAGFLVVSPSGTARVQTLPSRLSDPEFWQLVTLASEPNGTFPRENLTSNELLYQTVIPTLTKQTRAGNVYLGVGPEQNFTYIAAVRPAMAVIFDIRRDNLLLQLMYKSIFELSDDRVAFVSMLFSRQPPDVSAEASAAELFAAFERDRTPSDDARYQRNLQAITDNLTKTHKFPLSTADVAGLQSTYDAFYFRGFAIRYSPTYVDLMTATDEAGVSRSYLASEQNFNVMKDLESRNLVVPVVGDFGGPKAIRTVAGYLRDHGATVSAFYLSNVEQYLYQDGKWDEFCRNVATLPLDQSSTFIRSSNRGRFGFGGGFGGFGGGFISTLGEIADEVRSCE